jgi:predicted Zn-dependent protease with MMP-like domain
MSKEEFEKLVADAFHRLSENVKNKVSNVAFFVEDDARNRRGKEQVIKYEGTLLGLYEGIPRSVRGENYFNVLPDKITIFQHPIENICGGDYQRIKELVYEVVWHEVGHHFGFSERGIRELEKKRFGKKLGH